ncbi:MAG: transglutaminase domain-containing protein [Acetobacteraceae bacterium]
MQYRLRHTSRYSYGSPVDLATHMVHLRPRPLPGQRILSDQIVTAPLPARRRDGIDHFGNQVTWLFLDLPHADFEITADSTIDVCFADSPPAEATAPWESVVEAAQSPAGWRAAEFRFDSPMIPRVAEAEAYATTSFPAGRPVLAGLLELNSRIRADFTYRAGVTHVATSVADVLRRREGVCQDFAHVMISALRCLGLPARYVSGYVRTRPPPGQPRRIGADQSHAWVGCWLGPDHGWIDLDPTNGVIVKDEHVVLGWGRDYTDVSPVRGVILGGGEHGLTVGVDLEPAGETA